MKRDNIKITKTIFILAYIFLLNVALGQSNNNDFTLIKSRYASYHPDIKVKLVGPIFMTSYEMDITSPNYNKIWTQEQKFNLKDVKDIYIKKVIQSDNSEISVITIYLENSSVTTSDIESDGKSKIISNEPTYIIGFNRMSETELLKIMNAFKRLAKSKGAVLIN